MPDIVIENPGSGAGSPSFGGTGEIGGGGGFGIEPKVGVGECARQVLGLIPLDFCDPNIQPDCRDAKPHPMDCAYSVLVLADEGDTDTYKNDFTTMTVDTFTTSGLMSVTWHLDKCVDGTFTEQEAIDANTTVGTFFASLAFVGFPTYSEVLVLWRDVLINYGEGIYRIRVKTFLDGGLSCEKCTEPFCLKPFSCAVANGTTRWTVGYGVGTIGSVTDSNVTFGTPSANLYQIRVEGGFGDETSEYDEITQEYQSGLQVKIRDEDIRKYIWNSGRLPHWFHSRFKAYALMSPSLRVDDYNLNNPDYDIKQRSVIKDGGYEPQRNSNSRLTKVAVNFKDGTQNIEARKC